MKEAPIFTKAVRSGKIKQPTQPGFDPTGWNHFFADLGSTSEEDFRLHYSGQILHEWLSRVRRELGIHLDSNLPKPFLLRAYVAGINRDYCVGTRAIEENMIKSSTISIMGSGLETRLAIGPGGASVDVVDSVELSVSAVRYPLSEVFKLDSENQVGKMRGRHSELLTTIHARMQLAVTYEELSSFWADCLWLGWYVERNQDGFLIRPPGSSDHLHKVVGQARIDNLAAESVSIMMAAWENANEELKIKLFEKTRIIGITRVGKRRKLIFGLEQSGSQPPPSYHGETVVEDMYWSEVLDMPLPKLGNLSIRRILKAWDVFSSLGFILKKGLPMNTGVQNMRQLFDFAIPIPKSELTRALRQGDTFSKSELEVILDLFTFSDIREDPWQRPLVNTSDGNYLAIVPALTDPNLIRSVEGWMRTGGIELDVRGGHFEQHVKQDIETTVADAPYKLYSKLLVTKLVEGEEGEEEIDLLWLVGTTLLVGEIKCSIYPATPIEHYRFHEVLAQAALQAKRKSDFVKKNLGKVQNLFPKSKSISSVSPFIITNRSIGAGQSIDDVPVTDLSLLGTYLRGYQEFFIPAKGTIKGKAGYTHKYFRNSKEAETNLVPFLKAPFGIKLMHKLLDFKTIPVPNFSDEDPRILLHIFVNYDCFQDWMDKLAESQFGPGTKGQEA